MERVHILIAGAGAVGLAIGRELAYLYDDVVIVEKEDSYGRHTSSRNSEVIHSGIYYPNASLKAQLCVQGRELLYDYLKSRFIPYKMCGKLVVAATKEEDIALRKLYENGIKNGVSDLQLLSQEECKLLAPEVIAYSAMLVPCTGIMDTHAFMKFMKMEFESRDGFLLLQQKITDVKRVEGKYLVTFDNNEQFMADYFINSAGLYCEEIAKMAGIDTGQHKLNIHWCKAEYYKTSQKFAMDKLIYPMPDPTGMYLGIHLTLNLAGEVRFGPSAYYVKKIDYSLDEIHRQDFINAVSKYLIFDKNKIHADDTGIRPKLQGPGEGFRDFYIKEEKDKGLPGFINLMGIESPGLTSALAIARKVKEIIQNNS